MTKRFAGLAFIYAVAAMIFGVFYREFTKFNSFDGDTNLSVMHTHYFLLGMIFFLVLMLAEKNLGFSKQGKTGLFVITYQIGLNITGAAFFVRGITQVLKTELSKGADASLSGIAGLGHIILGVSLIMLLLRIKKSVKE